jgi:hypothetical protein
MNEVISKEGKAKTLNSFIKDCLDGKIGSEIYKHCKIYYPVKRIEVNKTEIMRLPTVIIEDEKPVEKPEEQPQEPTKEEKEVPAEEELAAEDLEKTEKPKKKTKAKTATKKKTTTKKTAKKKKEESPES